MIFQKTRIDGCFVVHRDIPRDKRGYFSRLADTEELKRNGLNSDFLQISASRNLRAGTLRGMHMQTGTSAEEKLVACVDGEVFDVCLDLRQASPTYLQYYSAILSEENGDALYVPKGCAHGFISLRDNSQLIYFMTHEHDPKAERGYRWDDPAFAIEWPMKPVLISDKDNCWPLLEREKS